MRITTPGPRSTTSGRVSTQPASDAVQAPTEGERTTKGTRRTQRTQETDFVLFVFCLVPCVVRSPSLSTRRRTESTPRTGTRIRRERYGRFRRLVHECGRKLQSAPRLFQPQYEAGGGYPGRTV